MSDNQPRSPSVFTGMSARLLVLTIFFIMLAEILIWSPSVSRFRKVYLEDHLQRAYLSTLTLEAMPYQQIDKELETKLLFHAEAYAIVLNRPERRVLIVAKSMPPKVDATFDTTASHGMFYWLGDAFETLLQKENRILRVIGMSPKNPEITVEIIIDEAPMRKEMVEFSKRIFELSLVISLFTAGLVFLSLQILMVRPMRRITASMASFREAPEDAARTIMPTNRADEIGIAQRQLAEMQEEVRTALKQKTRLATLGAAVAKVNHDLRNSLAIAVLAIDKLATIDDPDVKEVLPRMYDSIDRAVKLCSQTLNYVSDNPAIFTPEPFHFSELVAEAGAALKSEVDNGEERRWINRVEFEITVYADRGQLFRVIHNLGKNAYEAGAHEIVISARIEEEQVIAEISDNGPGLSNKAEKNLFEPFAGSSREGGSGLGLVIARDIMKDHGGEIELIKSTDSGATFKLTLPIRS